MCVFDDISSGSDSGGLETVPAITLVTQNLPYVGLRGEIGTQGASVTQLELPCLDVSETAVCISLP